MNLDLELEIAAAAARARAQQGNQARAVGTYNDGTIYERQDGSRYFKSPGYATSDPDIIAGMMDGASPAEQGQRQIDEQRIAANPVASRALKFNEGAPFVGSWLDEAVGAVSPQAGENMRANSAAMERVNPNESTALRAAGTLAYGAPMVAGAAPTQTGKTLGGQALAYGLGGAAAGGVEGAVYGAGEQDGGRGTNAVQQGIFGLGAGAVMGAASPYLAEGVKRFLGSFRGKADKVIAEQLEVSPKAAVVIKRAIDAGDLDGALDALRRGGDDAMLADAGQPARELLDAASQSGGRAGSIVRDAVETRVSGASDDMQKALDRYLGKPVGVETRRSGIRTGTASARSGAYDKAYSAAIDYSAPGGRNIERLLARVPQSAVRRANELMRIEGADSRQIMAEIADDGAVTFTKMPDVRQLDYITRALNDVAKGQEGRGAMGAQTALGRGYENLSRSLRQTLRREVPEYGAALDTAADAISRSQAVETGAKLLRPGTTREAINDALSGASRAEREAMKEGLRDQIDETLANVARTITDPNTDAREGIKLLRDMSSRASKQKLRMLLGSDASEALLDELDKAATAFELRAALAQNSKTAVRQAIQGSVKDQTQSGALESLASGEPVNASKRFVQLFTGNSEEAQALRQSGVFEEIATALTQIKGRKAETALRHVQRAIDGQRVTDQQAAFIGNVIASNAALVGSRETTRQLSR